MIGILIEAARGARAALLRARQHAQTASSHRPAHNHNATPARPRATHPPRPQPNYAASAALVLSGLVDPAYALLIALIEADQHRAH